MGDMQQRLDELEDKVQHIQKKQESFHLLQKRDNNIPEQQAVNHNAVRPNSNLDEQHKKEVEFAGFIGYVCTSSCEMVT
jgi:outer membrane murein-binding lipoprotein Lpp